MLHDTSSPSKILNAAFAAVNNRNQRKYGGGKDAGEASDALKEWRDRNGVEPKIRTLRSKDVEQEEKNRWGELCGSADKDGSQGH